MLSRGYYAPSAPSITRAVPARESRRTHLALAAALLPRASSRPSRAIRRCVREKTLREQAEQIANDRAALRMGPGGLESVVPEEERAKLAKAADTLSPFRRGVILAAVLLLFGGVQDGFWLIVQPKLTSLGLLQLLRSEESQSSSLVLVLVLLSLGAVLLYVGWVLLGPAPLPLLEDVLLEEEQRLEAKRDLQLSSLEGRWYYGLNLGQSYEIFKKDGEWRFEEELAGRRCCCTLRIVGSWVHGNLVDEQGDGAGLIRLRRTQGKSVVSNIKAPGARQWGNENEAIGW